MSWKLDKNIGSQGALACDYQGFEVSLQEPAEYDKNKTKYYCVVRLLNGTKNLLEGGIKHFRAVYLYANELTEAKQKALNYVKDAINEYKGYKEIDKRKAGFYCVHCDTFSKERQMDFGELWIERDNEKWLILNHYDGCRGWD